MRRAFAHCRLQASDGQGTAVDAQFGPRGVGKIIRGKVQAGGRNLRRLSRLARAGELRGRIAAELKTTFASHYTRTRALTDILNPEAIQTYTRRATGGKFLLDPSL